MTVLVLDGNENQAVACVRSLARAGHTVRVGASTRWSKAGWSRDCSGTFRYSPPENGVREFVESIAHEVHLNPGAVILPMTERTMLPLSLHRELITAARGRMVLPPDESVQRAVDKLETTRLAKSLGFITPETTLILEREHARDLAKSLRYPVVMKQRRSEEISSAGAMSTGGRPRYACNPQQFMSAYEGLRRHGPNVLAQEFIDGSGRGYFALVRHGEIVAEFGHRRLRDVHPTGSGSSVRLSVDLPAQIKEAGAAILRSLDWHGVAMVEFCVRHDGTPVFMEVNGRFWTSLALAVHAGVDFPTLLVGMADERAYTAIDGYRVGVRCRWLLGDVRHFMGVWYGKPEGYPGMFPKRLPTLLSILTPVPGTLHDNFCWRDPMPEVGDWLDFTCRRLPQKLRALFVD